MDAVRKRLVTLGYEIGDEDGIMNAWNDAVSEVKAALGCEELPDGIEGFLVDRAVRNYLVLRGVREVKLGDLALELETDASALARFRKVVW